MGKISNKKVGKNLLRTALLAGIITVPMINAKAAEVPEIKYSAHVEDHSWMKEVSSSDADAYAGTKHEARRMEALKIQLVGLDNVTLKFKAHIEDYGDREFTSADELIGTTGEAKRLEAITVWADGLEEAGYKLQYRVHIENEGDQDWRNAGEEAGSRGKAQRLESIQFRIVSKTEDDKVKAISQLKAEFKPSDYTLNKEEYEKLMKKAEEAINDAQDYDAVVAALVEYQEKFSDSKNSDYVKPDKVERAGLNDAKVAAVNAYVEYLQNEAKEVKDQTNDKAVVDAINSVQLDGIDLIRNANSTTEIEKATAKAKELAFRAVKETVQEKLDTLYNKGEGEGAATKYLDAEKYNKAIEDIKKVKSTDTITTDGADKDKDATVAVIRLYEAVNVDANKLLLESDDVDANTIKKAATKEITDFAGTKFAANGAYKDAQAVLDEVEAAENAIDEATTRQEVENAVKSAKSTILSEVKKYLKVELDKKYKTENGVAIAVDGKYLSTTKYNKAVKGINDAKTVVGDKGAIAAYEAATPTVITADVAATVKEIKDAATGAKSDVKSIISTAETNIKKATSEAKVNDIVANAIKDIMVKESAYYAAKIDAFENAIKTSVTVKDGDVTYKMTAEDIIALREAIVVLERNEDTEKDELVSGMDSVSALATAYTTALGKVETVA